MVFLTEGRTSFYEYKKTVLSVLLVFVLTAAAFGGLYIYSIYKDNHTFIDVYPVSELSGGSFDTPSVTYGTISTDLIQEVVLNETQTVKEILVKEGDDVTIGTPLVLLDNSQEKLDLDMQALTIDNIDIAIRSADHEIKLLESRQIAPNDPAEQDRQKQLREKKLERQSLDIDRKKAVLDYEKKKKAVEDGMIYASVNGQVKTITPPGTDTDQPLIRIASENSYSIRSTINEMDLPKYSIGHKIWISGMETGTASEAEITSIDMFPDTDADMAYETNPNTSSYAFTAVLANGEGFQKDEYVQIDLQPDPEASETDILSIPTAYLRQEDGSYYVYAADPYGRLRRRKVTTGAILYGYYQEILDGLSIEDKIAFPYGKNAKEGVRVQNASPTIY